MNGYGNSGENKPGRGVMVKFWVLRIFAVLAAVNVAGCGSGSEGRGPGMNVFWGGATAPAPALGDPLSPGLPPAPPPVAMGAFLGGPVGARLSEADRMAAVKAVADALDSGDRRTWRGSKGIFGYVVPGGLDVDLASSVPGGGVSRDCRSFTETIYFGGRPQSGRGTGCRDADGSWRIVS